METNAAALEIIKRNEGLRLDAYLDVVGVWTIGYGDTGPHVHPGLTISEAQAEKMLADRLAREFEPGVLAAIDRAPTNENQFSAMVSLAYNIGVGAFGGSTVARMHRAGDYHAAAEAFSLWIRAGNKVYPGLVRRRQEETALYLRAEAQGGPARDPGYVSADETIRTIQRALQASGRYLYHSETGKMLVVDGDFGEQSQLALGDLLAAAGQSRIRKE